MMNKKRVYDLLEVIEMPIGTKLHMIDIEDDNDYEINEDGELQDIIGYSLAISKKNIKECKFTIIEPKKNYNFRVYKDDKLINSFNKFDLTNEEVKELVEYLYYQNGGRINRYESYSMEMFSIPNINIVAEVIVDK